jgi:fructoselysine 6-phosphate deglycase
MAASFDRSKFIAALHLAREELDHASDLGSELSGSGNQRLFLVACGAPNQAMNIAAYWAKKIARTLEIRSYFPAELVHQDPLSLDQNTLVVLASHSGKTKEILQAAEFLSEKRCTKIAITQSHQSPLAQSSEHVFEYGDTEQGYYAGYLIFQSFLSALLKSKEKWEIHEPLLASLNVLPDSLADTFEAQDRRASEIANRLKDESIIYIIGAGPMYGTAYVIASCILMEMQWIHAHPLRAAEFFHGPFEVMDEKTAIINLLGEDPSRPEAERVDQFCRKASIPIITYDSKTYPMVGIDRRIRPILAPLFLDAALVRMAQHLADLRLHPLSKRRYMGKVEV